MVSPPALVALVTVISGAWLAGQSYATLATELYSSLCSLTETEVTGFTGAAESEALLSDPAPPAGPLHQAAQQQRQGGGHHLLQPPGQPAPLPPSVQPRHLVSRPLSCGYDAVYIQRGDCLQNFHTTLVNFIDLCCSLNWERDIIGLGRAMGRVVLSEERVVVLMFSLGR